MSYSSKGAVGRMWLIQGKGTNLDSTSVVGRRVARPGTRERACFTLMPVGRTWLTQGKGANMVSVSVVGSRLAQTKGKEHDLPRCCLGEHGGAMFSQTWLLQGKEPYLDSFSVVDRRKDLP